MGFGGKNTYIICSAYINIVGVLLDIYTISGALAGVRPKTAGGAKSTIELMAGSGLKYVHATDRGRQGMEGDLEKSKKQLLDLGYVHIDNVEGGDKVH